MKVTRLKRGYRINLSDAEFEALEHLVMLGKSDMEGADEQLDFLSHRARHAMEKDFLSGDCLAIDEDRR